MSRINMQDTGIIYKSISLLPRFGIEMNNWPQIVILGQQNEGKTSVIEGITHTNNLLPKCDGLATRKPIYITLINNEQLKFIVGENIYTNEIEARQELEKLNMNNKVNRINCTILSPYVYNCTIVDTIGLIHVSEEDRNLDPKKIKMETIEYLKDKNNILVLVSSAPSDLANSQMLQLIKKHGRTEDTLGIMTKIDLVENQNLNYITDILMGKIYKLRYGWIPTKLRSDKDLMNNKTVDDAIKEEREYCNSRIFGNFIHGVLEIRKKLSSIQFERIKENIPSILKEIDERIKGLKESQSFFQKIIEDDSDNTLASKLSTMIERLVGSSHERSQFENMLKHALQKFLLDYMDKVFSYNEDNGEFKNEEFKLENNITKSVIDPNIYNYHTTKKTVSSKLFIEDNLHELLNTGLISPITITNETLANAYEKECDIAMLLPAFELTIDDPLNKKKIVFMKYLEKYFSSLQNSNILQNKVYEITEKMLAEYINSTTDEEISKSFTEYIVHSIGQLAFEDKIRYNISSLVNIEQRPYVNIYDIIKKILHLTKSNYFDYEQYWSISYCIRNNSRNKISLSLYSDLWNRVYLITVIDRLALNCYRIVAVNLVNKMVENLLNMVIGLNKETSQKEQHIIKEKISILKQMKTDINSII